MRKSGEAPKIRELFIEELAQVQGGSDPLEKVRKVVDAVNIKDLFETTMACCEEGNCC